MARWFENLPYTNFHDLNLDWIVKLMKEISDAEDLQNTDIADLKKRVSANEEWIDNFDPDFIRETVLSFISSILATMIFVEISDAGYIVYHIPDGWESIIFNTTGLDINLELQPEYGHLVLSY